MNNIPSDREIQKKLEGVKELIKGKSYEKNLGRLNLFMKKAIDVWFFIEPVSGTVAKGAEIACSALDDFLNRSKNAAQDEIDEIFYEVFKCHEGQLSEIERLLFLLIPKASVTYRQDKWSVINGQGISSVTNYSNNRFKLNFIHSLSDPDNYFASCNVSGCYIDIDNDGVDVILPNDTDFDRPIKVLLQRMIF